MEILNPKVGTVPKTIREVFMVNESPRALFSVMEKSRLFWPPFLNNNTNYLKTIGAGKFLKIF